MNWRSFVIALLLPIWVTGATLASVARNRSGGRDAIVLSEREVFVSPRGDDNTTATLWLAWQPSAGMNARMAVASGVSRREERSLPRQAFVALELNGPAFRALPVERESERSSRLVAIDVDQDAGVLAQRYPNARTHLIAAGVVRVPAGAPVADGIVLSLEPPRIHVPREMAAQLPRYDPREERDPARFDVEVRYGRNDEPWVTGVRGR